MINFLFALPYCFLILWAFSCFVLVGLWMPFQLLKAEERGLINADRCLMWGLVQVFVLLFLSLGFKAGFSW